MNTENKTKRRKTLADFDFTQRLAIIRLRRSKRAYDAETQSDGSLAGAAYVLNEGTWQEVSALGTLLTRNFETFRGLAEALNPPCGVCCLEMRMKVQYGAKINDPAWIRRFLLGALKTFCELVPLVKFHEPEAVQPSKLAHSETAVRKRALRLGYRIQKCRERSEDSQLRGTYQIRFRRNGKIASTGHCGSFGMTLVDCESFLTGERMFSFDDYDLQEDLCSDPEIP